MKYILKESELNSILSSIIREELVAYGKENLNEGLLGAIGRGVGNLALNSLLGIVAPGHLAKRKLEKKGKSSNSGSFKSNKGKRRRKD